MRAGIRTQILANVPVLKDCYEPNVPDYKTPKPYAVVVQGTDSNNPEPTGFQRNIEVWIYCDIDTFKTIDKIKDDVVEALEFKTFTDIGTGLSYTAQFNGTLIQDTVDDEWGAIVSGLSFSVISLYDDAEGTDAWEIAMSSFIQESILGISTYTGTWKKDFRIPAVLCRTVGKRSDHLNYSASQEVRELRIHVASDNSDEVNRIINAIEQSAIGAIKIPLDLVDRRYLTVGEIRENRDAGMMDIGQITIELSRINRIARDTGTIEKISGRALGTLGS